MSQKSWEARVSTLALEVANGLKALAGPPREGDRTKARIDRAARAAGLSYWRAFDLWYGKARRIDAHEVDAIRAAERLRGEKSSHDLHAVAVEMEALAERLSALSARLDRKDADLAWQQMGRARSVADRVRRLASGD